MRQMNGAKRCSSCHAVKPVSDFHKDARRMDGYMVYCAACDNARAAARYAKVGTRYVARPARAGVCGSCGNDFAQSGRGQMPRFCIPCRTAICVACGGGFVTRGVRPLRRCAACIAAGAEPVPRLLFDYETLPRYARSGV